MDARKDFLDRWSRAVENVVVAESAFNPNVRAVSDSSDGFKFAVIHNPNRFERPMPPTGDNSAREQKKDCILCSVLEFTTQDNVRNLNPEGSLKNYTVVVNKFPTMRGHSLGIENGIKSNEKRMYSTLDLSRVSKDMEAVFSFAQERGLQAYHNSEGAGASIPGHEHWHFTNWNAIYDKAGAICGFDGVDHERTAVSKDVGFVSDFPFAHLIFDRKDPERIVSFLDKIGKRFNSQYTKGFVPHVICQGERGILVVPYKFHNFSGGIGSGDVAGHLVCKTVEDFNRADYTYCVNRLSESLFRKDEINLEKLL
ncbi:MAG: DUF4922 domain-containing protein [Nanoarchaeota archaeon]|nr:DUF4922 domain-containing protein [Nanoarchaeota archaeon]